MSNKQEVDFKGFAFNGVQGQSPWPSLETCYARQMQLHGIHHLTAITANARGNHDFYTGTLGLRLVKKTVNQDDVSAYHLFYADGQASPGSDITFFDWPAAPAVAGTRAIVRCGFRVDGAALDWWRQRLEEAGVAHGAVETVDGRREMAFSDPEGQRLALVDDGGVGESHAWEGSAVPPARQIRGLGPVAISVPRLDEAARFLTGVLAMRAGRDYAAADGVRTHVFEMGEGGPAAELHVRTEPRLAAERQGAGGVHHVAFRIPDDAYDGWVERLERLGVGNSGPVDRYYFRSLYMREPNGILYEIATDGPGFATDETMDALGQRLALPPFLEGRRTEIERGLKAI